MYKLYTFCKSSTAWRARIALNMKGIKPQYEYVNLLKGQQKSQSYKKIHPNYGVPTLITPNGTVIFQTMAIIQYLNQVHPQNNLFPGTKQNRAHIRAFCEVINSGIHPYQNLRVLQKLDLQYKVDKNKWVLEWVQRGANMIETMIKHNGKSGKFIFGDQPTCADIFFYPQIMNTKRRWKIDISKLTETNRILANLQKVPQFHNANPQYQKDDIQI